MIPGCQANSSNESQLVVGNSGSFSRQPAHVPMQLEIVATNASLLNMIHTISFRHNKKVWKIVVNKWPCLIPKTGMFPTASIEARLRSATRDLRFRYDNVMVARPTLRLRVGEGGGQVHGWCDSNRGFCGKKGHTWEVADS